MSHPGVRWRRNTEISRKNFECNAGHTSDEQEHFEAFFDAFANNKEDSHPRMRTDDEWRPNGPRICAALLQELSAMRAIPFSVLEGVAGSPAPEGAPLTALMLGRRVAARLALRCSLERSSSSLAFFSCTCKNMRHWCSMLATFISKTMCTHTMNARWALLTALGAEAAQCSLERPSYSLVSSSGTCHH